MSHEIERRFLPKDPTWLPDGDPIVLAQGFFRLGQDVKGVFNLWPWPSFRLGDDLRIWLTLKDALMLYQHVDRTTGELPDGWKARVRSYFDTRYVLEIKGPRNHTTRPETDPYTLPLGMGKTLLSRCGNTLMRKRRYEVMHADHLWHVDVNISGMPYPVLCEVELAHENEKVVLPPWVGEEITSRKVFQDTAPPAP